MRTLSIVEFVTLDGVMQGLGSPDEDRDGGFAYGGWGGPYVDDVMTAAAGKGLTGTTAYLFGRVTYEKMIGFWPSQPDSNPMAAALNASPKYVATRTLTSTDWHNSQILDGELVPAVRALKETGEGTIVVLGSGVLVHDLMLNGLVDEFQVFLHPLLLGTGKRLFRELPAPITLELAGHQVTGTGVLMLSYRPT